MDIDFAAITEYQRYKLMASLMVPRPIALVTTLSETGVVNAAPFIECTLWETLETARRQIFIGPVRWLNARDDLIDTDSWRVRPQNYFPVARFGAGFYVTTRERFTLGNKATTIDEI